MFVFNFSNFKKFIKYLSIPLLAGFIGYLLGGNNEIYSSIIKPPFAPPPILFPIVWTILYILMGISSYIISNNSNNYKALQVYYIQLVVNLLWPLFFFRLNLFLFSSLWILLLLVLVIYMFYLFFKINKTAALLQLPYIVWLIFASILNFSIYILND